MCATPEELATVRRLAGKAPVCHLLLNHSRRFDQGHRQLAAMIAEGEMGEVLLARVSYSGGWLANGSHAVDTLRML